MKFTKILLVASIAAISTTSFASNGGFYIGANTGASIEKYAKLKKTKVIAEGVLGYDFHFDTIVLGMDFNFGTTFGKIKKSWSKVDESGNKMDSKANVKTQWQLGFMPRIGYLITPDCELYLTAGVRVVKHKFNLSATKTISYPNHPVFRTLTASEKKTKVHPVAGLGMKYNFTQNLFAKAEYNYLFKTKSIGTLKYQAHGFKLGFGYKF